MNLNGLLGILSNDQEHAEYEDVYNENGDAVYCDSCGEEIRWKDGIYFCMGCGKRMSRQVFFDYIGATPPGPHCIDCDNPYPGCITCPYGYVDELSR